MKPALKSILLLCSAVMLLQGCDFIRSLAGRPTSAQIAEKKAAIEAADSIRRQEARKAAAVERMQQYRSDSLEAVSFLSSCVIRKTLSESHLSINSKPDADYYVNLGAFKNPGNARKLLSEVTASGYQEAKILPFSNGLDAVVIPVKGDVVALRDVVVKVSAEKFCPEGLWVLEIPKELL